MDNNNNDDFRKTWETYASSWSARSSDERKALFSKSLTATCQYADPLAETDGWEALDAYMIEVQKRWPGVAFVTKYFLAHHNRSVAKWEMLDGDEHISAGTSFGEYDPSGKLLRMTGFFEVPAP